MNSYLFEELVLSKSGFLRGPFGGDLKKEIFVSKDENTYKVYEQGVVLQSDESIGRYYITSDYFKKKMHRFEVQPKDFLVSCSGVNYGAIHQLSESIEKGVINQALLRIRLNKDIVDDNYFYYLFKQFIVRSIIGRKGDSTIPNFPPISVIKKIPVKLPDIFIQKNIGSFLKSLDSKIELNNRINRELEGMAKLLYDYWFVQFDFPISEEQAISMGKPELKGKPYKSSGGPMAFNEQLKREVPEGWGVEKIGNYAEVKKGELITEKIAVPGLIKVVAAGINYSYTHTFSNRLKNTITISGSGANAGYINFWRESIFASDCITVRGRDDTDTIMLKEHLNLLKNYILSQATGSAQPHVYPNDIKILNYTIPPDYLKEKFGGIVIPINDRIANNSRQNQQLTELRDWLLPMLMNGQVRIGEAKKEYENGREVLMAAEERGEYEK